jgi:hypothetical protein
MQFNVFGKGLFMRAYLENYDFNRRRGMRDYDAYRHIVLEQIGNKVQGIIGDFLKNNPDIDQKIRSGTPLSEEDLAKVSSALSDAAKNGQLKTGYQLIQGFLVNVPPPK